MKLDELLIFAFKQGASDLHISSGLPPMIRKDGDVMRINLPELTRDTARELIYSGMTDDQVRVFEENWENDFSLSLQGVSRFRVNVFYQNRGIAAVYRTIPETILSLDDLGCPKSFVEMMDVSKGLILVTGPTGSGKSTTLAGMINYLNNMRNEHILTIEDPIEFVHTSKKCLINQREIHRDTKGFSNALRSALREDPDIILVGEMRDLETIRLALTAAETGHLVFGTLHTSSASKTVDRIIDVFPGDEKALVRSMLSESLRGVIAQTLMKKIGGGRTAGWEIMLATSAIKNLIREDKVAQMYSSIQTGGAYGMQTLDQHLKDLVDRGFIELETAKTRALNKEEFTY